ncbi:MAG: hypothetical protein HYV09_03005 [Deltaproteobacteria bacterium]|nr:hypothetical protein [Deltaproteobacteria bacterium]
MLAGCGAAPTASPTPVADAAAETAPDTASIDVGAPVDAANGDAPLSCEDPTSFPRFGRTCVGDADCAVGLHRIDCCGSLTAVGLRADQRASFEAAESTWRSVCPECDVCMCSTKPTTTDSGRTVTDPSRVVVACQKDVCVTAPE